MPVVSTRTADAAAQTQTYDERVAADQTNLFRPNSEENRLSGPKVLGKIDVNLLEKKGDFGRREKRKRITKDKVDLNQKPAPAHRVPTAVPQRVVPVRAEAPAADRSVITTRRGGRRVLRNPLRCTPK